MISSDYTAVLDACSIYPASQRDLLIRLSQAGFYRARFSDKILDEMVDNLLEKSPNLERERLERTKRLMIESVDESLVVGYEPFIETLELPDPDDRHVLAAAIRCDADAIVTLNERDFPSCSLKPYGIVTYAPDELIAEFIDENADKVLRIVREQRADLIRQPVSSGEMISRFNNNGLKILARFLQDNIDRL